jgi:hypothetical protein
MNTLFPNRRKKIYTVINLVGLNQAQLNQILDSNLIKFSLEH